VFLSTQASQKLNEAVKKGQVKLKEENGIKTYLLSIDVRINSGVPLKNKKDSFKFVT